MDFTEVAQKLAWAFDLPNGHFGDKDKITLAQALRRAYINGQESVQCSKCFGKHPVTRPP